MKTARRLVVVMTLTAATFAVGQPAPETRSTTTRPALRRSPMERLARGPIVSVSEAAIVIRNQIDEDGRINREADGVEKTIDLQGKEVEVFADLEAGTLADLKPGMVATVQNLNLDRGPQVQIQAQSPATRGLLEAIEGTTLTVRSRAADEPVKVQTDDKTKVIVFARDDQTRAITGKPATLVDLKPGMNVQVIPPTGVATKVIALPARTTGGPATRPTP